MHSHQALRIVWDRGRDREGQRQNRNREGQGQKLTGARTEEDTYKDRTRDRGRGREVQRLGRRGQRIATEKGRGRDKEGNRKEHRRTEIGTGSSRLKV